VAVGHVLEPYILRDLTHMVFAKTKRGRNKEGWRKLRKEVAC
jgi:hypothetical protein